MKKYGAILIDPAWDPWSYSHKGRGRHPSAYYDTMSLDEIAALPVADYAAKDCSVFLWITDQFLVKGLKYRSLRRGAASLRASPSCGSKPPSAWRISCRYF